MQHPDEGMIHSWLDGALPAEDAGRIEAHVAECAECRTTVAEARGFIAASSRILTALDDVPRGVLPAAAPRRRDLRVVWRAAAAMLIVAGGSVIVMREGDDDAGTAAEQTAPRLGAGGAAAESGPASPTQATALTDRQAAPPSARAVETDASAARESRAQNSAPQRFSAEARRGSVGGGVAQQSVAMDAALERGRAADMSVEATGPVVPLKVIDVERRIGERRTIYEIALGDTVTLTETESVRLEEVVVAGAAAAAGRASRQPNASGARAVAPTARSAPAATPPPPPPVVDSAPRSDTASAARAMAKSAISSLGALSPAAAQTNTIRWSDATTGKTLTLSGKLSIARLEEIKLRIEKERAGSKAP